MQVEVALQLCGEADASSSCVAVEQGSTVTFRCRGDLLEAGFPIKECQFQFEHIQPPTETPDQLYAELLAAVPRAFLAERTNAVVYAFGEKGTPKRRFLFGGGEAGEEGFAQRLLREVFGLGPAPGAVLRLQACTLGEGEEVADMLGPANADCRLGRSGDSVSLEGLTAIPVADYAEAAEALRRAVGAMEALVGSVRKPEVVDLLEDDPPLHKQCECPCYPYLPCHFLLTLNLFASPEAAAGGVEQNSLHLLVLGDSERPPLCGVHLSQMQRYSAVHKSHSAVVAVLGAIRTGRLRVPYNKAPLTSLLRRAYNQDKASPYCGENGPTKSFMIVFAFAGDEHAEETYHSLITGKRITTVTGTGGVGPISRDLDAEKWRLEQDILDLQDELQVARAVHDYKPCIYGQPKPVANIEEEEARRMVAIRKRKEEGRAREAAGLQEEAARRAADVQRREGETHAETVQQLQSRLAANAAARAELEGTQPQRAKAALKDLEKTRRKRDEEEAVAQKALAAVLDLEAHLAKTDIRARQALARLEYLTAETRHVETVWTSKCLPKEERQALVEERRATRGAVLGGLAAQGELVVDHSISESVQDQLRQYAELLSRNAEKGRQAEQERAAALQAARAEHAERARQFAATQAAT